MRRLAPERRHRYATTTWDPDGPGPQTPKLVIGGNFTVAGSVLANSIAMYNIESGSWTPLGAGIGGVVLSFATSSDGSLIIVGADSDDVIASFASWDVGR